VWDTAFCVGAWRSLVARAVRVGEVPGSNPGAPIVLLLESGGCWGPPESAQFGSGAEVPAVQGR
jgi:hypothetical protein